MTLSWSAATDDKGVKNYDVYRGAAKIATVTGTTYTDSGLTAGTDLHLQRDRARHRRPDRARPRARSR